MAPHLLKQILLRSSWMHPWIHVSYLDKKWYVNCHSCLEIFCSITNLLFYISLNKSLGNCYRLHKALLLYRFSLGYELVDPGIGVWFPAGAELSPFFMESRLALGPTQHLTKRYRVSKETVSSRSPLTSSSSEWQFYLIFIGNIVATI